MKNLRTDDDDERSSSAIRLDPSHPLVSNLAFTLDELFPALSTQEFEKRCFGTISVALICLGNGLTDEAHDLVTPLSWPSETSFGYGPPIVSKIPPEAKSFATHVHCLVHRKEGFHIGEFGMEGFNNAAYWASSVKRSEGMSSLPHNDWLQQMRSLLNKYSNDASIQEWGKGNGFLDGNATYYDPQKLHDLCAQAMKDKIESNLRAFAEEAAETEVRVLLAHSLQRAGFDCSIDWVLGKRRENESTEAEL